MLVLREQRPPAFHHQLNQLLDLLLDVFYGQVLLASAEHEDRQERAVQDGPRDPPLQQLCALRNELPFLGSRHQLKDLYALFKHRMEGVHQQVGVLVECDLDFGGRARRVQHRVDQPAQHRVDVRGKRGLHRNGGHLGWVEYCLYGAHALGLQKLEDPLVENR